MTILIEDSIFLHIPKTAGNSLRALFSTCCARSFYHLTHSQVGSHITLSQIESLSRDAELPGQISVCHTPGVMLSDREKMIVLEPLIKGFKPKLFAFVRHPVQWWGSYWAYRQSSGWTANHPIDLQCRADHFETFIENVLRLMPGRCSRMMREFVGYDRSAVTVGRYEALEQDFDKMLTLVGFPLPFKRCAPVPRVNVSGHTVAKLSAGLEAELCDAEHDIIREFYLSRSEASFETPPLETMP